jgi:NitT/TauT family transport system permease protein
MLREGYALFAQHGFAKDVGMTVWRVVGGFVLARCSAFRSASRWALSSRSRRSSSRSCRSQRYLPASAFIPLLILWAGSARRRSSS